MDIWLVVCNLFVFGTLVEYCYAQVQLRKKQRGLSALSRRQSVMNAMTPFLTTTCRYMTSVAHTESGLQKFSGSNHKRLFGKL